MSNKERQAETKVDSEQMPIAIPSSPNAAKPNVSGSLKVVKRGFTNPVATINLFLIPLLTYILCKSGGVKYHHEFIWWITIPAMMLIWFVVNFKIIRVSKNYR